MTSLTPVNDTAFLWLDIDAPVLPPPVESRQPVLPFGQLTWENFERLCFRLAHRIGEVENVRLFGVRGQDQEGIDIFIRRADAKYDTWQCKRYKEMKPSDIKKAVTEFLEEAWAAKTTEFRLAVACSLNVTSLAKEIEVQRELCRAKQITLIPFDGDTLSEILKNHPDLVDDFFGRGWVTAFNGPEAANALSNRRLTLAQRLQAGRYLHDLYATHFRTVDGGIPAAARTFRNAVTPLSVTSRYVEPSVEVVESVLETEPGTDTKHTPPADADKARRPGTGFRRRDIRTTIDLSAALAASDRCLMLGRPGFGKSAALRVIALDLLGDAPRFPGLARRWGQRLPLFLPFNFLSEHFAVGPHSTIEDCLHQWLHVLGAKDQVLTLLAEALQDERLLLLVDGLDEWQNRTAAATALTALTNFAQLRGLPVVATGRPLGFARIDDLGPEWKRINLLPLDAARQREFAAYWFRHFHQAEASKDATAINQAVVRDGDEMARQLRGDPSLSELGSVPLLLSVLVYLRLSGRVLPNSRRAALEELVRTLLEDQPGKRALSAMQRHEMPAARSPIVRRGLDYLAFRIHGEDSSVVMSNERALGLLRDFYRGVDEFPTAEAAEWAAQVIELGRHEFGILVAPQKEHVGFLHRIFQEYLAARHLARRPLAELKTFCHENGGKISWHEVTLALLQIMERTDEVDALIDVLTTPPADAVDEPGRQLLLTRLAVAPVNSSRSKARGLVTQSFHWIERGLWMPIRMTLVREVVAGLESPHVAGLVAERLKRWFPGRKRWWHDYPLEVAARPDARTPDDLLIALSNADSPFVYRSVAEGLARCRQWQPTLEQQLLSLARQPAEAEFTAAVLHALATGWPEQPELDALLKDGSASPAKDLRRLSTLTRFKRGERTTEIRDALAESVRYGEHPWPWEKDIVDALITGWPNNAELKALALRSVNERYQKHLLAWDAAMHYLLRGCAGDDEVAALISRLLAPEGEHQDKLNLTELHVDLLEGFKTHPVVVAAARSWLDAHAVSTHNPLEVSVLATVAGPAGGPQHLIARLDAGEPMPNWIISTLVELSPPGDQDTAAALARYASDPQRRARGARNLPLLVPDPGELSRQLHQLLQSPDTWTSIPALEHLVRLEAGNLDDFWPEVKARLENDPHGFFWRFGHQILLNTWPQEQIIHKRAAETVFDEDISVTAIHGAYSGDAVIGPLLAQILPVLHSDLRLELARSLEPLAERGVAEAVAVLGGYRHESQPQARTIAARAYARALGASGQDLAPAMALFHSDLTNPPSYRDGREQAAAVGLLELGHPEMVLSCQWNGRPGNFSTHTSEGTNWDFIAGVVDHWESMAALEPNLWPRFEHSAEIASALAKAGKRGSASAQTEHFEKQLREGGQIDVSLVEALIALHGPSPVLRDLFLARLNRYRAVYGISVMLVEMKAYHAIGDYLVEQFGSDALVAESMQVLAVSSLMSEVARIALCRRWPSSPQVALAAKNLPALRNGMEPVTAWIFATQGTAAEVADFLMQYPNKLKGDDFGFPYKGIQALRDRLRTDAECREAVFERLQRETNPDCVATIARLAGVSLRTDRQFRKWVSAQVAKSRGRPVSLAPMAFDGISHEQRPLEFSLLEALLAR